MVKIIGALFIIIACSGAGFYCAQGFINRTKEIRQLQNILSYLETEIIYGHTPLLEIMKNISLREKGSISKIFAVVSHCLELHQVSFADCWRSTFEKSFHTTALKSPEQQIILQLGNSLGQSDRDSQQKYIRIALSHLQTEEQDAFELQKRYEKLSRALGVLTGILIVILLI